LTEFFLRFNNQFGSVQLAFEPLGLSLQAGYLCRLWIGFAASFPRLQPLPLLDLKLLSPAGQMRRVQTFPPQQSAYFAGLGAAVRFHQNALFVSRTEPPMLNWRHHFRVWPIALELTILGWLYILLLLRHRCSSSALIIFDSNFSGTVVSLMLALRDLEDPAAFVGSEEEILNKFREVRDQIEGRVKAWVTQ
jgi:hypothetical protein